jgi:hypothetical protein
MRWVVTSMHGIVSTCTETSPHVQASTIHNSWSLQQPC